MSQQTNPSKKWPVILLTLNVIGAIAYVHLASRGGWVIRQECDAGIRTITGEPFVWFSSIAPVIAIFFVLNLTWVIIILRHRQWIPGRMWLATAAIWLTAAYIDFSHHQC